METIYNDTFTYKKLNDRMRMHNVTTCHLEIYKNETGNALVIATELHNNEGMSITNSSESMASVVRRHFGLNPTSTIFVEHYNAYSYVANPTPRILQEDKDRYAQVLYTWEKRVAKHPQWSPWMPEEDFEKIIKKDFKESENK